MDHKNISHEPYTEKFGGNQSKTINSKLKYNTFIVMAYTNSNKFQTLRQLMSFVECKESNAKGVS